MRHRNARPAAGVRRGVTRASRLPAILRFPNPVNEVAARVVAGGVVVLGTATIALDQAWLLVLLAYGFVARVSTGPTLSPLAQLATRVVAPRLAVAPKLVPGPPKRFAQGIGAALSLAAVILHFGFGATGAAHVLVGLVVAAATLEAVVAFCLGCRLFSVLMRLGVIPRSVCVECDDIWSSRVPASS